MGEVKQVIDSHDSPLRAQLRYSSDVWSKGNKYAGWYWRDPPWHLGAHRPHETALELDDEDRCKRTKEDAFDSSESNQMLTKVKEGICAGQNSVNGKWKHQASAESWSSFGETFIEICINNAVGEAT
ncbi:hypothetical protein BDR04DRAFT_1118731 [Suillus decipiens]|nr:hypothetical protein BDR04DRAFT_1118731 [Suillus decipiens]